MTPVSRWFRLAFAAVLLLAACGTTTPSQLLDNGLADNSSDAEQTVEEIIQQGGFAITVRPGEAVFLAVDDPNSDLFGTSVSFGASALPEEPGLAVLSITPRKNFIVGAGQTLVGPPMIIALEGVTTNLPITLRADATVVTPYSPELTGTDPASELFIGIRLSDVVENVSVLKNTVVDQSATRIVAQTNRFGPMAAIRDPIAAEAQENSDDPDDEETTTLSTDFLNYSYSQFGKTCNRFGARPSVDGYRGEMSLKYINVGASTWRFEFDLEDLLSGEIVHYEVLGQGTPPGTPTGSGANGVDPGYPTAVTAISFRQRCKHSDGTVLAVEINENPVTAPASIDGVNNRILDINEWDQDGFDNLSNCGEPGGTGACTRLTGTARIQLSLELVNPANANNDGDLFLDMVADAEWETP